MTPEQLKTDLETKLEHVKAKIQTELLEIQRLEGGIEALNRVIQPFHVEVAPVAQKQLGTDFPPAPHLSNPALQQATEQQAAAYGVTAHTTPYLAAKANRIASKGKVR